MDDNSLDTTLMALVAHVGRWRSFTVGYSVESSINGIVVALHSLAAPNHPYMQSDDDQLYPTLHRTQFILTGGAPCLSHSDCNNISIESCWPTLGAVTDLRLCVSALGEPLTRDRFEELLTSASAVGRLLLRGDIVDPNDQFNPSSISLPISSYQTSIPWKIQI
jgi:hypothetical protein